MGLTKRTAEGNFIGNETESETTTSKPTHIVLYCKIESCTFLYRKLLRSKRWLCISPNAAAVVRGISCNPWQFCVPDHNKCRCRKRNGDRLLLESSRHR
ncbi:unnamed protein product [Linum tenue]|uniref:Uncharacterized protein n=1 Tax=Linum tenue TaxID=586396 RepID=A0AAV0N826_9ROSI|nr:unnamed protein product [Linum tenue]